MSSRAQVRRNGPHDFTGANDRGAELRIGRDGDQGRFTPGELLDLAVAGCAAMTSEELITRRLGEDAEVTLRADGQDDEDAPHRYGHIRVGFDFDLTAVEDPQRREAVLDAVRRAIERQCTVSRTVEHGARVDVQLPQA